MPPQYMIEVKQKKKKLSTKFQKKNYKLHKNNPTYSDCINQNCKKKKKKLSC